MDRSITVARIKQARSRIHSVVRHTPVEQFHFRSAQSGVLFKLECLQVTGSFKIRGAMARMTALADGERSRGVLTVSAGNHGLAVAHCSARLGAPATVVVPENASRTKVEAIRRYGARLIKAGASYDEAEAAARQMQRETGLVFVSPYNDPDVIAGQGTVGLEILEDVPDVEAVVVPVGGGGLIAGVALALKAENPAIKVYGVEPSASPTMWSALAAGHIVEIREEQTIADGLAGNIEPESMTFPIVQRFADGMILVDEAAIRKAIAQIALNEHFIIEGSAAAAVAALSDPRLNNLRVVAILTGRNIDLDLFKTVIESVSSPQ